MSGIKKRRLGQDGALVHPVGIGGMSFTNFYGETTEQDSHDILSLAMDYGVDHLDTANIYGMGLSEEVIGKFLKKEGSNARDFFIIASKAGINRDNPDRPFDSTKGHLKQELDKSLTRLGVEAIDLYYIHRRDPLTPLEEVVDTLKSFIADGKIKNFGFSEIAPTTIRKLAELHPMAAVQSEYSLSNRGPELGVVRATKELGMAMVAFSPVGRSLLTDRPHTERAVQAMPFLKENPRFIEPNLSDNVSATEPLRGLAKEMGVATSSLAIAWLLHQDSHIITIPGTRSKEHFLELVKGAKLKLTPNDLEQIDKILPQGWAHGDRYSQNQWNGIERYC